MVTYMIIVAWEAISIGFDGVLEYLSLDRQKLV